MDDQIVCPNCHSRTSRSSGTCSFCGQSLDTQNQPLISEHDSSSSNQEHDLESSISMFARMLHEISSERSSSSSQDNTRYTPLEVQIESDIDPPSLASNSEYTVFPLRETGFNRANTASQSPVEDEHETESLLHTEDLNSSDSTPSEDHNTNASGNRPPPSDRQRQINREMATNLLLLQTLLARNMRQNRERQRHARTSQQNQESGSNSSNNDPSPGRLPTRIDRNMYQLLSNFSHSLPFLFLLFLSLFFSNILVFFILFTYFTNFGNIQKTLKDQIVRGSNYNPQMVNLCIVQNLLIAILPFFTYHYTFKHYYFCDIDFYAKQTFSLAFCVSIALLIDIVNVSVMNILKLLTLFLPSWLFRTQRAGHLWRKKRHLVAIIEQFYLIIRHSHNILLWGYYYSGLMGGYASFFLPYLYVSTKISVIVSMVAGLVRMIHTYFIDAIEFGQPITAQEILEEGRDTTCPICFCEYENPVKLSCSHCFCYDCIASWFEKENTCPMCRTEIDLKRQWIYSDGCTSANYIWY